MGFEIRRFEVLIEPRDYYIPGDRVNCLLILDLTGILKSKHVLLTAIGEISAKFNRAHMPGLLYTYINETKNIMQQSIDVGYLGILVCFLLFQLDIKILFENSLLPSFKVNNGQIRYYVQAIIDKKLFTDFFYSTTAEFTVKTHSNITPPSRIEMPLAVNCEKLIRMLGMKVGSVRLSAHLDRNYYYPGEYIQINFHLDNRSSKPIRLMPQLIQKTSFKDGYVTLNSQETVSLSYSDICEKNFSVSDVVYISIPENCVPTIDCSLIDIIYELEFHVEVTDKFEYFKKSSIFIG